MLQEKYKLIAENAGYNKLTPFQEKVIPAALNSKYMIAETAEGCGKNLSIIIPAILLTESSQPGLKSIIIASSPGSAKKLTALLKKFFTKKLTALQGMASGAGNNIKKEYRFMQLKQPDIFIGTTESIIDHIRRENIDFSKIQNCIIEDTDIEDISGFERDVEFIFSKMTGRQTFLLFTSKKEYSGSFYSSFKKPFIIKTTDYAVKPSPAQIHSDNNGEYIADAVKSIIKDLKENEDPHRLDYLKKIIKKNVSIFMRGCFSAYLLDYFISNKGYKPAKKRDASSEKEIKTIFINAGKNRGLFFRDLAGLMLSLNNVEKTDIQNLKVLDNYSFAEVNAGKSDFIIKELNRKSFKGRKINADYARNSPE